MSKGGAAATKGGKKKAVMYVIDCAKPVGDKIMDIASLEKFLQERIKVGGKPGALGDTISLLRVRRAKSLSPLTLHFPRGFRSDIDVMPMLL
ncbi:hypothetical protein QQ045_022575 [Rhodiola kirilowii]